MKKNSKNLKENPMIKKGKKVKSFGLNNQSEDEVDIKTFLIILGVIVVVIVGIYFVTNKIKKSDSETDEETVVAGEINYDLVNVGMILNRPYDEYYVLVYDSTSDVAVKYSAMLNNYMDNENEKDYVNIFYCDLDNYLNKPYYNVGEDNKSNPKATKIKDFDFGDLTLLKIKDGKVVEYLEDYTTIHEKLK